MTFDVDYTAMSAGAKASLATALEAPFCGRIAAAGVPCADLVVELAPDTAGSGGRRARQSGATNATVALPSGTRRSQANNISDSIVANPIAVQTDDGPVTSTAASITAHLSVDAVEVETETTEESSDVLLPVLVIVVIIMLAGCIALVLRHRSLHSPIDLGPPKGGLGGTPISFDKNSGMTPAQQLARAQLQQARLEGAATASAQPPSQPSTTVFPTQEETYAVLASKSKRNIQAAPPQETYAALGPQAHDAADAAAAAPPRQETYSSLASQSVRKPVAGAPGGPYAKLSPGMPAPVVGNTYQYLAETSHAPPVPITDRPAPQPGTETYETIDDIAEPMYEVDPQSSAHAEPLGNDHYELPTEPQQAPINYEPPVYAPEQEPIDDHYDNAEALGGEEILNKLWTEGNNPTHTSGQQDCSPDASRRGTDGYIEYDVPGLPEEAPNDYAVSTGEGLIKHDTVWEKHNGNEKPAAITEIATEYGYEAPNLTQDPALVTPRGSRRPSQIPLKTVIADTLSRMGSVGRTLERDKLGALRLTPLYSKVPAFRDSRLSSGSDDASDSWTEKSIMQPADQADALSALYPDTEPQYSYDRDARASLVNPTYEAPADVHPVLPVYSDIDAVTGSEDDERRRSTTSRTSLVNPTFETYETPDRVQPVQPIYSDVGAVAEDRRLPAANVVYASGGEVTAKPAVDAVYATTERKTARRSSTRKVSEAGGGPLSERAEVQPETEFVVVVEGSL